MSDPLFTVLVDVEKVVGRAGWDQPARLFALVGTAELLASEPSLAEQAGDSPRADDALSAVESDGFELGPDLYDTLAHIGWGPQVQGCVLALERTMVPADVEDEVPADPQAAALFVARHPRRMDLRVVAGALRDGSHHVVARLADRPDELLAGQDMVPGLTAALAMTLADQE
jgi:hypothetical protein